MLLPARKGAGGMGMKTFLVQVWVAADDTQSGAELRGVVRHVTSGVETIFRGEAEVLNFLRLLPGGPVEEAVAKEAVEGAAAKPTDATGQ